MFPFPVNPIIKTCRFNNIFDSRSQPRTSSSLTHQSDRPGSRDLSLSPPSIGSEFRAEEEPKDWGSKPIFEVELLLQEDTAELLYEPAPEEYQVRVGVVTRHSHYQVRVGVVTRHSQDLNSKKRWLAPSHRN